CPPRALPSFPPRRSSDLFLMSVGASAGIALLAGRVAERLPGPRPVATAMGVTIGAQIGVAPVLIPLFGSLPLAALPANLLAVPRSEEHTSELQSRFDLVC